MLPVVRVTILSHSRQLAQPALVLQLLLVSQLRQLVLLQVAVTIHVLLQAVSHGKSRLLVVRDHQQVHQQGLLLVGHSLRQDLRLVLTQARDRQQVQDQVQDHRPVLDLLLNLLRGQVARVVEAIVGQVLLQEVVVLAVPPALVVVVALVPVVHQAGLRVVPVLVGAVVPADQAPLLAGAQAAAGAVVPVVPVAEAQVPPEVPLAAEVAVLVQAQAPVVAVKLQKTYRFL